MTEAMTPASASISAAEAEQLRATIERLEGTIRDRDTTIRCMTKFINMLSLSNVKTEPAA